MNETMKSKLLAGRPFNRLRDRFAQSLGVKPERKEEIYLELAQSASLRDTAYWLQLIFAAGVATLGLAQGSPAVIIGAMLISPLMGPILAAGLALAAGDFALGLRAGANLALSCLAAIVFSVILVALLPFKEMTGEIAARTQPNTLDLVVALFSGAIGSIAICKEVKGVVTSIPGVAIAVALMPPLCVVGYGAGVALSLNAAEGMRVARGGGLLFLTNLVAITFTATVVFVALHIDTERVKERVREWRSLDPESQRVQGFLDRLHVPDSLRQKGSLPGRLTLIFVPLLLISIPLTQSLTQLKREITRQQEENRIRRAATELWRQKMERLPNGAVRSYFDQLAISEPEGKLTLSLRVFTSQPYAAAERTQFAQLVAARLNRPVDSVRLELIEVPTTSEELAARSHQERQVEAPPTVAQLTANLRQGVEAALRNLRLPPSAQMIDCGVTTGASAPAEAVVLYLCDREISADARTLIVDEVRARFADATAAVKFERIPASIGALAFARNQTSLNAAAAALDRAGQILQRHPKLRVEIAASREPAEPEKLAEQRAQAVADYLTSKWQVAAERIAITLNAEPSRTVKLGLKVEEASS
jgi:uncharacterized hydrophobic protein (TIGR00271 family)